ncbi:MAG: type II toxin-antitoxin system HicA family toxin [bacterium]
MIKVLEHYGFVVKRWNGSHAIMTNGAVVIPIPCHSNKNMPTGMLQAIIRDSGLSVEEYEKIVK